MIVGTGIDIVEIERIAEKLDKAEGFREKVFSANEILFCESKTEKHQHYAARFAAKEAFLKATGKGFLQTLNLFEIEVVNDHAGKPSLALRGSLEKLANENRWTRIHISLSHVKSTACAVVIIEG